MPSEGTEGRERAGPRDPIGNKPLAALKATDGRACPRTEDSVDGSRVSTADAKRDLKCCDVRRPGVRGA